jgi:hypothetical protein
MDARAVYRRWLGYAIDEALKRGLLDPPQLISHASPDVMVTQLPREVTAQLLEKSLESGTLTPASVLQVVPPALMAEHVEPSVLWRCVDETGVRAKLAERAGAGGDARSWLAAVLERAVNEELVSPAHVLRLIPPPEIVRESPLEVVAQLIRAGLSTAKFDPDLVLEHLTPRVIAEKLPPSLGWSCVTDMTKRSLNGATAATTAQAQPAASPPAASPPADAVVASVPAPPPVAQPAASKPSKPGPPPPRGNKQMEAAQIDPVLKRRSPKMEGWQEGIQESTDVEVLDDDALPPPPLPPAATRTRT